MAARGRYTPLDTIREGNTVLIRARAPDGNIVLIKILKQRNADVNSNILLEHEFSILSDLHNDEASNLVRALAIEQEQPTGRLVLEDFGQEIHTLETLILRERALPGTLTTARKVDIAFALASALDSVHRASVLHLAVKPSSVLISLPTWDVRLADFEGASRLPLALGHASAVEGVPAYIAPEQTGRVSERLDARTDLYSLGILLYELLTLKLPFDLTAESLEWVHAHLARFAPPASDSSTGSVPRIISDIIEKLMEKEKHKRYQSAVGLQADFERLKTHVVENPNLEKVDFALADKDNNVFLSFPTQIFGRDFETQRLLHLYEGAKGGLTTVALVPGEAGVGKSAMVANFHRKLLSQGPSTFWYAHGKCEDERRSPLAVLIQVMDCLIEYILGQGRKVINAVRGELAKQIDPAAAAFLGRIVPSASKLLGELQIRESIDSSEITKVFHPALLKFLGVVGALRPLVLVLEDLHWADAASLEVLEVLISAGAGAVEKVPALIIMTYRDDEESLSTAPALTAFIAKSGSMSNVSSLSIGQLRHHEVSQLVAAIIGTDAPALVDICVDRTGGNPMLVCAFLQALFEDGVLRYNRQAKKFVCSDESLTRYTVRRATQAVVQAATPGAKQRQPVFLQDMIARRMDGLPDDARSMLAVAAVLGVSFSFDVLRHITGREVNELHQLLYETIERRVIERIGGVAAWMPPEFRAKPGERYRFLHDKLHEGSLSESPAEMHLVVAEYYVRSGALQADAPTAIKFETLGHFNYALNSDKVNIASGLLHDIARYNLEGIRLACAAVSFDVALTYAKSAVVALRRYAQATSDGRTFWQLDYDLSFNIFAAFIELVDEDDAIIDEALQHTGNLSAAVQLMARKVQRLSVLARHQEAVEWGIRAMRLIGEDFPELKDIDAEVAELTKEIALNDSDRDFASCMDAPLTGDEARLRAVGHCSSAMLSSALAHFPQLLPIITGRTVRAAFQHGFYPEYAPALTVHASMLAEHGKFEQAQRLSLVAVALEKKYKQVGESEIQAYALVAPYIRPLKECAKELDTLYHHARTFGERLNAGYASFTRLMQLYVAGEKLPLKGNVSDLQQMLDFAIASKNSTALGHIRGMLRAAYETAYGAGWRSSLINDFGKRMAEHIPVVAAHEFFDMLPCHWSRSTFATFHALRLLLADQNDVAYQFAARAVHLLSIIPGSVTSVVAVFATVVALGRLIDPAKLAASDPEHLGREAEMARLTARLKHWADACPANYGAMYHLALGETKRLRSASLEDVLEDYDIAITLATENQNWYCVALGNSCIARRWASVKGRIASLYNSLHTTDSMRAYRQWGVLLDEELAERAVGLENVAPRPDDVRDSKLSAQVDAVSLLKASRVISSELNMDRLMDTFMNLLMESAGAQHACVLRPGEDGEMYIEAASSVAQAGQPPFVHLARGSLVHESELPLQIINLAMSKEDVVVVEDARRDVRFMGDPFVIKRAPTSIMCAPLLSHGRLQRVVYVQSNLMTGAFTTRRLAVFRSLVSQAAVSLENSLLYEQLATDKRNMEETRDEAVRANKSKSAFLATVSHEIRTPMNGILSMTSLLADTTLPPETKENVEIIKSAGQTLLHLIESILDVSKIEAGKLQIDINDFDAPRNITACFKMMQAAAEAKKIDFRMTIEESVPRYLRGDAMRMKQILTNLLSNALKFTERGSVTVHVSYSDRSGTADHNTTGGPELLITVEDTGIGISAEDEAKLFRTFSQADSSSTRRYDGAGLGLAISQNLARFMGGDVWFTSTPGRGTKFYCALAFGRADTQKIALSPQLETATSPEIPLRVLIADDNHINQRVLVKLLAKLGHQAEVVSNGAEAVQRVRDAAELPYHLVLMDIFMPNMDGMEATQLIRSTTNIHQPYIVAVTANAMIGDKEKYLGAGMTDYLPKPVNMEGLQRCIDSARASPLVAPIHPSFSPRKEN